MPVGVDRYICDIGNGAIGLGNLAQVHFDIDIGNTQSDAERVASMIAYLSGPGDAAVNTSVVAVTKIASGAAGGVPVPFPVAEYAAYVAADAFLVPMTGYATAYGSGALATAGTSMTVALYTATPGRSGTGRHYRPYLSEGAIDGTGGVAAAYTAGVDEAYRACFFGTGGATWAATPLLATTRTAVYSPTAGVNDITTVKVSGVPARLRSRVR